MPVILTAALLANMQLIGLAFAGKSIPILGNFDERGTATGGLLYYLQTPNTPAVYLFTIILLACVFAAGIYLIYRKSDKPYHILLGSFVVGIVIAYLASMTFLTVPTTSDFLRFLGHSLFLVIGSIIFSIFWVSTSGMDAKSVSEQIEGMGMQIPGFRRDPRIIESVLNRYIPPLAVMGGLAVGLLAAVADLTGALGTGTGILLTVMIIYSLYEQISMQYAEDMHPAMRKFFKK